MESEGAVGDYGERGGLYGRGRGKGWNHLGYPHEMEEIMLHDLLHLMRSKDVNIKFLFYMMVTMVIGDYMMVT